MEASRINRAKQFLPFDALKGFKEALKEKEVEHEDKKELTEETLTELNDCFNKIEIGSKVKIIYYKNGKYNEIRCEITNINYIKKKIQINGNESINVCDIINMQL